MVTRLFANHKVFNIMYRIIWIPKYGKHILVGKIEKSLKSHLEIKANKLNIRIEPMEIMSDHIHLFIKANTNISISKIVRGQK